MSTIVITPPSIVFWRDDQIRWGAQQTALATPFEFESTEQEDVVREAFNNAYIQSPAFRQLADGVVAQEGAIRIGHGCNSAVYKQADLGIDAYLLIDINTFDDSLDSTNDFNFHKDGSVRPTNLVTVMAHEFAHLMGNGHPLGMNPCEPDYASVDLNEADYDYAGGAVREEWRVDEDMGLSSRTQYGLPISPSLIGTGPGQFEIGRSFSEGKPIDIVRIAGVPDFGDIDISSRTDSKAMLAFAHENGSKITGGLGNDFIYGSSGADRLYGAAGEDSLMGGAGDDWLDGGEDADVLNGGDGFDTASYRTAASSITLDLLNPQNSLGDAAGDTLISIEKIVGSNFDDRIIASATEISIWGGKGNDTIDLRNAFDHVTCSPFSGR